MRITNGMMVTGFKADYNNSLQRLSKYQSQMETGKRIQRLSDDPVGIISALQARRRLYRIDQFERNIGDAKKWLDITETATTSLNKVVSDAYESLIDAATDVKSPDDRQKIAEVIKACLEEAISLGNTSVSDEYSFGGFNTTSKPFSKDAAGNWLYNGQSLSSFDQAKLSADTANNTLEFQVGFSINMRVTLTGAELMVYDVGPGSPAKNKNVIDTLQGLYDELMKPDSSASSIEGYISDLQSAMSHLSAKEGEFGGRQNRLDMMLDRYSKDAIMYTQIKSNIEDVDEAEAIMNFSMAQLVYNAALQAGAKVIQPTLMDYLR